MLILTRRPSESIIINDNITITVLGVKGNQVRLGICAPDNVKVNREEIYNRKYMSHPSDGDAPPIDIEDYNFNSRN